MSRLVPVYQLGTTANTIHLGRPGRMANGIRQYEKVCGTSRRDRYYPVPVDDPSTPVTCKRCLAYHDPFDRAEH